MKDVKTQFRTRAGGTSRCSRLHIPDAKSRWLFGKLQTLLMAVALLGLLSTIFPAQGHAQIPVNALPFNPAVTNFDAYNPSNLTNFNATIPTGWSGTSSATATFNGRGTGTGTGTGTGGYWAYGSGGEFSLGALRSGTPGNITYSVNFTNNSGKTITSLTLSWDYEQWRFANTSGWNCSGTGALAGNATLDGKDLTGTSTGTNGTPVPTPIASFTLTGLSIANGASFGIQWVTTDPTGADNGIAIDNFSISIPCPDPDPVITDVTATPEEICPGGSSNLEVTGTLGGATDWHWYTGSCGGTPAGTGTMLSVSPTMTTTYYVRGEGGCITPGTCDEVTVTVLPAPAVSIDPSGVFPFNDVCVGDEARFQASPTAVGPPAVQTYGWTFSGAPTTSQNGQPAGDGITRRRLHATYAAGDVGNQTVDLTVTYTNGCMVTAPQHTITVNENPSAGILGDSHVCMDSTITLDGGSSGGATPYMHSWMQSGGTGTVTITDNGDGTADITGGTPGVAYFLYSVTDDNGCIGLAVTGLEVVDCASLVFEINDPCACNNDQTANGAQDGTFAETVSVPANPAGDGTQTWTVTSIMSMTGATGPNPPTGIAVNDLLTYNGVDDEYQITFTHSDDAGYEISVEGPNAVGSPGNVTLMVSNICQYPVISFNPAIDPAYCTADPAVTLGVDEENAFSGTDTYTINGNTETQLDPTALGASTGNTLVALFVGDFVSNMGGTVANPAFPGCETTLSTMFDVNLQPIMVAELNGVSVTNVNDGIDDTGAFDVCHGIANNVSITTNFSDLAGASNARVYQTIATTNATYGPWCNNCQALLSAFTAGTNATAALIDPTMVGTVVITFQAWQDDNNNGIIDPEECTADVIEFTVTVNPLPVLTAQTPSICPADNPYDLTSLEGAITGNTGVFAYEFGGNPIADPTMFTAADGDVVDVTFTDNGTGCSNTTTITFTVKSGPPITINQYMGFPFNEVCVGDEAVFLASPPAAGNMTFPPVQSYFWTYSGAPAIGPQGQLAADGITRRRLHAMYGVPDVGPQTIGLTVEFTNGCFSTAPTHNITVNAIPTPPTPDVLTAEACEGVTGPDRPRVRVFLPGPPADFEAVWVIGTNPAGIAPGTEYGPDDSEPGVLTLNGTNRRTLILEGTAPVGTYEFSAKIRDRNTGCESDLTPGFELTLLPLPVVTCPADFDVCIDGFILLETLAGLSPPSVDANSSFSGPGVTPFDISAGEWDFEPAAAGVGTHTITYTYTDPVTMCSNSCTFEITVNDLPVVTCPADLTVCENDGIQTLTGTPTDANGTWSGTGVTDNGDGTADFDPAGLSGSSPITATYTYTDGNGCTNSCSFDITVNASPAVNIIDWMGNPFTEVCVGEIAVFRASVNNSGPPAVQTYGWTWSGSPTTTQQGQNAGDGITMRRLHATYGAGDAGLQTVDLTVTYANGCMVTAPQHSITVHPLPVMTCPDDLSVCLNDADFDLTTLTPTPDPAGGTFSGIGVSVNMFSPLTAGIGTHTITYEFTDGNGCTNTCTFEIEVENPTPTVTCPADITINCGEDETPANTGMPTAPATACCVTLPMVSHIDNTTPGACPIIETIEREFTIEYTDCAFTTTCTQTITVQDVTPPLIVTCPADQTIEWVAGFNTTPVGPNVPQDPSIDESLYPNIVYTELCNLVSIDFQDVLIGPDPLNCPNLWVVERTWTLTDGCGLTGTCVQTFTFTDTTPPVITCPADPAPIEWPVGFNTTAVGSNTPQDPSVAPAIYDAATATDNCGNPTITYQDVLIGPDPANCPNLWVLERTWTATDACGLVDECVQTFTFTDTTPPAITDCPPAITVEGCGTADIMNGGLTALAYSETSVTITEAEFTAEGGAATDNCAVMSYSYVDISSSTCPTVVTRVFTVTDACGLTHTCTQTITIDDTTPPMAACMDITIDLNGNGEYNLTPSEVFDAAGSSDACGTVTPVSVSPSYFSCDEEGANTVTLTVEDGCGNPSTCTATVTVNPFITIVTMESTDETCNGASDGTITMLATAPGGTMGYSIDGGTNFNFTGMFTGLPDGTYNLVFRVFGITGFCEVTATLTVGSGSTVVTCYRDADNDGYTNGQTTTACSCPPGYVSTPLPGGDCNDNNGTIFPTAPELCDGLDNNCDGTVPANENDVDADGYRICAGDCNDTNAAINPGATEVCNGKDDDCDGSVDEGVAGGTYVGNLIFNTQVALDAFPACYTVIQGSVTITGSTINNLGPLSNITQITGNLSIMANSALTSLNGLGNITNIGGSLIIYYNFALTNCCAIDDLLTADVTTPTTIGGPITIFLNGGTACNSAANIMSNCPLPPPMIANPTTTLAVGEALDALQSKQLTVYPNPAGQEVNVLFNRTAPTATFRIMDMLGRVVYEQELGEGTDRLRIDLGKGVFDNGLYLVSLLENGEMLTKQLVVQQ